MKRKRKRWILRHRAAHVPSEAQASVCSSCLGHLSVCSTSKVSQYTFYCTPLSGRGPQACFGHLRSAGSLREGDAAVILASGIDECQWGMRLTSLALLRHHIAPSMSNALKCPWIISARLHHTHQLSLFQRHTVAHVRQRFLWQQQRSCKAAPGSDNGNSASAAEETFFATTPLYYVRLPLHAGS